MALSSAADSYAQGVAANPEYYEQLIDAFRDTESLTVLVVAGRSREEVAAELQVDVSAPLEQIAPDDTDFTGWALSDVPGGVLAVEVTGYGDPSTAALTAMSAGGRSAAVVRSNIQAHLRFGCARDGELLFDDDEYMYVDDISVVPAELRSLFDLAWDDLESDSDDEADGFIVGLAMAEAVTGVELTRGQVEAVMGSTYFQAPALLYVASDE